MEDIAHTENHNNNYEACEPKENHKLLEKGHIQPELIDPSRNKELDDFLTLNNQNLLEDINSNFEKFPFMAHVPPQNEWQNAPDLQIIDRRTGQVVKVLEMGATFELCEGICLQIKAKELEEWEKETADARKLNKEQHETFKAALEKIEPDKPLTRKEIVTLIEEIRKPQRKLKKYRQSGHLIDQKLKYQLPKKQLSLFDILPETKQKIEESRLEVKAEGIKLTYAENKLVHALNLLLCEKSQNTDPKLETYYSGNEPSGLVPYGVPNQKAKAAMLKFKPAELYKAFVGSDEYSGADVKHIINTLHQLADKKVLIRYDRVKKVKEGKQTKTLTDRIEEFQSLIKVIPYIPDLSDKEKANLDNGDNSIRDSRGEIIIALNPIFTDQIDTKFIEFPEDTNRRLVIAAGGHNKVTASMGVLMEYLLREMSAGRFEAPVNEDRLPYILGLEKYIEQKRKKLMHDRIEKDIQAIINIGIILKVEKLPNSIGGLKWVFYLNKDYG